MPGILRRSLMDKIQNRKMQVGELKIHYVTGGEGKPLVIIHGGANGAGAWKKNLTELAKHYTVYAPDLPGFGRSQEIEGDFQIPELVKFVDAFTRNLGLKSFHLIGHSLGGAVAVNYVLQFPNKITKLVLVSSMCLGKEVALWVRFLSRLWLARIMGEVLFTIFRAIKWAGEKLFVGVEFLMPFSRASMILGIPLTTLKEQTIVLANRLSDIMVPTLVVWGAKDRIVPPKQAYNAGKLIPHCQVVIFDDCGHSVYREKLPEFSQLLTRFLDE
jgi:pimeloyl-ACP methyl ester carboxylesterase